MTKSLRLTVERGKHLLAPGASGKLAISSSQISSANLPDPPNLSKLPQAHPLPHRLIFTLQVLFWFSSQHIKRRFSPLSSLIPGLSLSNMSEQDSGSEIRNLQSGMQEMRQTARRMMKEAIMEGEAEIRNWRNGGPNKKRAELIYPLF